VKRIVGVVGALLLVAGCSSSVAGGPDRGALSGSITVDAASSLTEAFDSLKTQFEAAHPGASVKITYGASSDLATQIAQGAAVDVFASASEKNMADLGDVAEAPTDFVTNTLEIAVPPGNPARITSVADLARSGVKVAMCDPAVPCGAVAAQVFRNAGVTVHPAASLADVKSTLAAVESGEVDAGLVYVTDIRAAADKVAGVVIPRGVNASTTYPIAVLHDSHNARLARAFVDFVLSAAGRKVLAEAGFEKP
jgi:molybdate transport system substrate-binding protein